MTITKTKMEFNRKRYIVYDILLLWKRLRISIFKFDKRCNIRFSIELGKELWND